MDSLPHSFGWLQGNKWIDSITVLDGYREISGLTPPQFRMVIGK